MNWSQWYPFSHVGIMSVVPKSPGVYAFRQGAEIIYYGKAESSLEARMLQHLNSETDFCLKRAAAQGMEMQWAECSDPASEEESLLRIHLAAYNRRPRCNNRIG
jgi:excinuclease UvrABC nuclease subunit